MQQELNPNKIDVSGADIVAYVSSARPGATHWTELGIFYLPSADGRCFVARAEGCSRVQGQTTRRRSVYVGSVGRAIDFFDAGDLKDSVVIQAHDWMDRNGARVESNLEQLRAAEKRPSIHGAPIGFTGSRLIDALRWLYGHRTSGLADPESSLSNYLEQDFGVPGRTVRESLKNERAGKELPSWCRAFIGSLMHFDREAFHAAKGGA